MSDETRFTLAEAHKEFAKRTNGRVWQLLDKENRNQAENDELLYAAFASCYHWYKIGTGVHRQRGEYLVAKVYMSLNNPEQALHHAQKCLALTKQYQNEMEDFDFAFAYEGAARVYAMNGKVEQAMKYHKMAREAGDQIEDAEDKQIFDNDLKGGNWFGLI